MDVGGTFVDCVVMDGGQVVASGKAPADPDQPVASILEALGGAAEQAGLDLAGLLEGAGSIVHGTTVGLNALLTRAGSSVGLLATRGHEDAILIGRVRQKIAGLGPDAVNRVSELRRPDPIVPRRLIRGIDERLDRDGAEVVRLDEQGLMRAAEELVDLGCAALAIAFLWSFRNPKHERRAAELIEHRWPELPVVRSSVVAPVIGEYERTATTVVNAYLLTAMKDHLVRLRDALLGAGFRGALQVMLSSGGAVPAAVAERRPVETLGSGPVGGVIAAQRVCADIGAPSVIATDMGGTSFDVSLVVDGRAALVDGTIVDQLDLAVPAIEVRSIGAGGGSVAWLDGAGDLHVGPDAAPRGCGPACYGLGGTQPTVTDADLLLGRLNPDAVLGGRIRLDRERATAAIAPLAARLGASVVEVAAGIVRIADAHMTDLIRAASLERGHDPRRFTLLAFGGAGPLHVGAFAPDLGVRSAVIPALAPVLSSQGLALAQWRRPYLRSVLMPAPLDIPALAAAFAELEDQAQREYGLTHGSAPLVLQRSIDMRYRRQTHHVRVPMAADEAPGSEATVARFEREYEAVHGPGTGYRAAGIEATAVRVDATVASAELGAAVTATGTHGRGHRSAAPALPLPTGSRDVFFGGSRVATPVFRTDALAAGASMMGPALIDGPTTTLVIHPGQATTLDEHGHLHLTWPQAGA